MVLCPEQDIRLVRCIENKANYELEPYEEGKLVVYTHGYMTPGEQLFLRKLRDVLERQGKPVRYEHSGDLDYGGFGIYQDIRKKGLPELQPRQMGLGDYEACVHRGLTKSLEPSKAEKLKRYFADPQLGELAMVLARDKRRVEQEAYLVEKE